MHTPTFIGPIACAATLCMQGMVSAAAEPPTAPASAKDQRDLVEVWVVLSEPALATLPVDATEQRASLQERITKQQDQVMAQLAALGATESGRIQQVSNAIAVRMPTAAIQTAKKIDGVTSVYPVSSRNRIGGD